MKLEDIDHLFKNNERQFDLMPDEQVWSRLEQRLAEQPVANAPQVGKQLPQKQFRLRGFWRYAAAAVLVLVVVSPVLLYLLGVNKLADQQMAIKTVSEKVNMEQVITNDSAVAYSEDTNFSHDSEAKTYPDERNMPAATAQQPDANTYSANTRATNSTAATETITNTSKPEMPEVKQRGTPAGRPPAPKMAPQPQRSKNTASGTTIAKEEATLPKPYPNEPALSTTVAAIPTANPPLADLAYSRYYAGLAQAGLQKEQPNGYNDYNAVPPVTNNSGKPYIAPADAMRDESKTTTQKKQSAKQVAPAAGSKDDAPATITQKNITWLWGTWISTQNNTTITENWQPSGKADISSMVNGNTYFTETAAIKPSGKGLVYTISNPQTGNSTTYQLSGYATANNLIFENKDNTIAYPGIIAYHLVSDNTLYVTFTGLDQNGLPRQTTLLYKKQ